MSDYQSPTRIRRRQNGVLTVQEPWRYTPISLSITEKLNDISTATMVVSLDDEETPDMAEWIRLYTAHGDAGVYRVTGIEDDVITRQRTVTMEHLITWLKDSMIFDEVTAKTIAQTISSRESDTCTVEEAVHYIMRQQNEPQGNKVWETGTISYSGEYAFSFQDISLYDALVQVLESCQDGMFTYTMSGDRNYELNIVAKPESLSSEMRLSRNINAMTVTMDATDMYTRLYPTGYDGLELTAKYVEDTDAQSVYGIIAKTESNEDINDKTQLASWGRALLKIHKKPRVTMTVTGYDLWEDTGESIDKLIVGTKCRVPIKGYDDSISELITSLEWQDLVRDSRDVIVTISNEHRTVATIINYIKKKQSSAGRASKKNGSQFTLGYDQGWAAAYSRVSIPAASTASDNFNVSTPPELVSGTAITWNYKPGFPLATAVEASPYVTVKRNRNSEEYVVAKIDMTMARNGNYVEIRNAAGTAFGRFNAGTVYDEGWGAAFNKFSLPTRGYQGFEDIIFKSPAPTPTQGTSGQYEYSFSLGTLVVGDYTYIALKYGGFTYGQYDITNMISGGSAATWKHAVDNSGVSSIAEESTKIKAKYPALLSGEYVIYNYKEEEIELEVTVNAENSVVTATGDSQYASIGVGSVYTAGGNAKAATLANESYFPTDQGNDSFKVALPVQDTTTMVVSTVEKTYAFGRSGTNVTLSTGGSQFMSYDASAIYNNGWNQARVKTSVTGNESANLMQVWQAGEKSSSATPDDQLNSSYHIEFDLVNYYAKIISSGGSTMAKLTSYPTYLLGWDGAARANVKPVAGTSDEFEFKFAGTTPSSALEGYTLKIAYNEAKTLVQVKDDNTVYAQIDADTYAGWVAARAYITSNSAPETAGTSFNVRVPSATQNEGDNFGFYMSASGSGSTATVSVSSSYPGSSGLYGQKSLTVEVTEDGTSSYAAIKDGNNEIATADASGIYSAGWVAAKGKISFPTAVVSGSEGSFTITLPAATPDSSPQTTTKIVSLANSTDDDSDRIKVQAKVNGNVVAYTRPKIGHNSDGDNSTAYIYTGRAATPVKYAEIDISDVYDDGISYGKSYARSHSTYSLNTAGTYCQININGTARFIITSSSEMSVTQRS